MKNFITNNWKKILIIIGGIFIAINVFSKIVTEKSLLTDYIKYGKDIEQVEIISGDIEDVVEVPESPFNEDMMKIIFILGAGILLVVFVTSLADKAAADAKAKKK